MQFPNKLYSYKNSTLALLPEVLIRLKNEPVAVKDLFWELNPILEDPTDFLSALDCLYAMQIIDMTEDMEAIFLC